MSVDYSKDICEKCAGVVTKAEDGGPDPEHKCAFLPELDSYDWEAAFGFSQGEWVTNGPKWDKAKDHPFNREEVAKIYGYEEGENDGPNWIMLGQLHNGLHFFLSAGCDYTGWDCQAGGTSIVCDNLHTLIRFGMTREERERLGATLLQLGHNRLEYEEP